MTSPSTCDLGERPRCVFYGRTARADMHSSLAIGRQLASCAQVAKSIGAEIAALYWEVVSGRKSLEERDKRSGEALFGTTVPRDGGINELLRDAASERFDAVIIQSIDRLSRMPADASRVEQELERFGVGLLVVIEPMTNDTHGSWLSISRQLASCAQAAESVGLRITAHYGDT